MFDDADALIRLDMSEYGERHTVSRMIGAPPGYVGYDEAGGLTEAVRRRPYSVILFDEIEKAHPEVLNVLLQIMEDGRLTDGHGRTVNFRHSVVIMTSNLGSSSEARGTFGFVPSRARDESERTKTKERIEEALRRFFKPEFLNRVDDTIIFEPLTQTELGPIVELMLKEVQARLDERKITIEVTDAAKLALIEEGYDAVYGARPLRRVIERQVENALARRILAGEFAEGERVVVDHTEADGFLFAGSAQRSAAASA
jgi:ATP-dependent Clp protease ATP-binding subunit ClpC